MLVVEDEPFMAEAIRDGLRLEAIAADGLAMTISQPGGVLPGSIGKPIRARYALGRQVERLGEPPEQLAATAHDLDDARLDRACRRDLPRDKPMDARASHE